MNSIGWRTMLTRTPRQGYLTGLRGVEARRLRPYAGKIGVATLCLVGEEDGSTPVAVVRELAGLIKGSRFEIIPHAGHVPNIERLKRSPS